MAYAFSFVFPFLLVATVLLRVTARAPVWVRAATVAFAGVLTVLPVGGLPLARWYASFCSGLSVTVTVLLAAHVWGRLTRRPFLDEKAWRAAWWFGAGSGLVLYPMALGLGRHDPYALGWGFVPLGLVLWVVTVGMVLAGNRLWLVLTAAVLAFELRLLDSLNLWDYVLDPAFALVSAVAIVRDLVGRVRPAPEASLDPPMP